MMFVYKNDTNKSEFVILDAKIISAEPIARILLPQRVPHGLHGSWFGYMQ
jgi:carotenoid cleavage dioxygenase